MTKRKRDCRAKLIAKIKSVRGCQNKHCPWDGEVHSSMLNFHHVNEKSKLFSIGAKTRGISARKLIQEIEKCCVLCSNCHAVHHYVEEIPDLVSLTLRNQEVSDLMATD